MSYADAIIVLSSVAVVLLFPPLGWHAKTRNTPAILLIMWLLIMNVKAVVDAAVWGGQDFKNKWSGHGWCDVMTKLQIGANVGVSCCVANIAHNLYAILRADTVLPEANSWKRIGTDLGISLFTPVLAMGLSYLVQVFRFGIFRYNGCQNMLSPTWVTTVTYTLWMFVWSLAGFVYALLLLYVFYQKRKDVRDILHCTNSGLNLARFARLLIFCMLIILVMFPFSVYSFVVDLAHVGGSYSFGSIHNESLWNVILRIDPGKPLYSVWLYVLMSYLVFLIFGLGADAIGLYATFARRVGLGPVLDKCKRHLQRKRDARIYRLTMRFFSETGADEYRNLCQETASEGTISMDQFYRKLDKENPMSQAETPTSARDFVVDYVLPQDIKRQERRRRKGAGVQQLEDLAYINDPYLNTPGNGGEDDLSLGSSYDNSNSNMFVPEAVCRLDPLCTGNHDKQEARAEVSNTVARALSSQAPETEELQFHYRLERKPS